MRKWFVLYCPDASALRICVRLHQGLSGLMCFPVSVCLIVALLAPNVAQAAAVGAIAGQFSSTPLGGALYTIPLPTPGGAGGLSPKLSLVYASGSGPGLLGWDMTIGGLSAITRCPSTWPYDGSTAPVDLTSRDRFCLSGGELTLKSGTYGDNGAVYVTTPTSHEEEISYTSNNAIGPQWFKVLHPDGSVWEYGHQYNSEVTATNASGQTVGRVWALDKITDANGNTVTFHYSQPTGTGAYYLTEVDWGANTSVGTTADHKLVFSYATVGADATVYRYVAGTKITWNERASKLTLEYNGATTLTWTIGYLADGQSSNRSRLASVTECDAGGSCLPATSFNWQQGTPGYGSPSNTGQSFTTSGYSFVEDVNGDGREDLVYDCDGVWCLRLGKAGGGFGNAISSPVTVTDGGYAQPIHYQPGPGDQILFDDGGYWGILSWNGTWSTSKTAIAVTGPADAVDVNGDGYDDLVTYSGNSLIVRLNTTISSGAGFGSAKTAYSLSGLNSFVGFRDIGSDGARGSSRILHFTRTEAGLIARVEKKQRFCITDGCTKVTYLITYHDQAFVWNNGALATYGTAFGNGTKSNEAGGAVIALDANGDGLTDVVPSGTATLLLNTGSGFTSVSYGSSTSGLDLAAAVAVDYSGSDRDDLLVPDTTTGDWMRLASTGTGFAAPVDTGIASGSFGSSPEVVDSEGRMMNDLVGVNSSGDIELAMRSGNYPDLLSKVTDGFGNYDSLAWDPLSANNIVTATYTVNKTFELRRRGRYVLASDQKNNGIGGSYSVNYTYDTPVTEAGAGFAGIHQVSSEDLRDIDTTTRVYAINKYAPGIPSSVTVMHMHTTTLREEIYAYNFVQVVRQGQPLVLKSWTTTHNDMDGNPIDSVQRIFGYDANYMPNDIKITTTDSATGDQWINETARTNDESTSTSDWCMNLASAVTVTDTLPSGASASHETTYTPNVGGCYYENKTIDTNLAKSLQTYVNYGRDAFGNTLNITIQGHNPDGTWMTKRETKFTYDSHGEFQTSKTDPMGDVTHMAWNAALGVKTSMTAANGAITSYSYDGFGRRTKTTLPSGGYENVSYTACSNACGLAAGAYYTFARDYTSAGAVSGETYKYYDREGREVYRKLERAGGKFARVAVDYNALGEISQVSTPYYSGDTAYWTQFAYDALKRVKSITAPASTGNPAGQVTNYNYGVSPNGLVTTVTKPDGSTTTVTKNPLGQIKSVTDAAGTSSYTYGPFYELKEVDGADNATTTLTYDAAGHRTKLSGPDRGTLSFSSNSLGEVVTETNARGQTIGMQYDTNGRVMKRCFPTACGASGTEIQSWTYATSGNGAGQLASESDSASGFSRGFTYNSLGEPTQVTETLGTAETLSLGYDSLGRLSSITYPVTVSGSALTVNYAYDAGGNLSKVTNAADGTVYWQPESGAGFPVQNALGQWEAYTLGGGLDIERLHDAATGALTSMTSGPNGGGGVLNSTYTYNDSGSTLSRDDLNEMVNDSFQYDGLQRLLKVTRSTSSGSSSSSFTYGASGQFTQGPAGSYSYGSFPKHSPSSTSTGGSLDYNADGDRTSGGAFTIGWNALGEATSFSSASGSGFNLLYGPDGGLVQNTGTDGGRYLGHFLKEADANDWSARIVANGKVIAVVKDAGGTVNTDYLVDNSLGSTAAIATGSGTLMKRIAYGAWGSFVNPATGTGNVSPSTIAAYTTVTYTGHELLAQAGLIEMGARLYDPATGLFMSPDPTVAHLYSTQDLNQYSYTQNNPLTFTDPQGYSSSGGQPVCTAGQGAAPSGGGSVISAEALNGGQAFVAEASLKMWGGSTGLSETTAVADVLEALHSNIQTTINAGINDILFYEQTGMHGPSNYDSMLPVHGKLINWHNLQVNWGKYGAGPGDATSNADMYKLALQAMCEFFQDANSKTSTSSSRGKSGLSGGGGGLGNGGGVGLDDPFGSTTTTCFKSRAIINGVTGPWQFDGCVTT